GVSEADGITLPPVKFKEVVRLGDVVWVAGFPWGRQLTVVSGVVSQLKNEDGDFSVEGTIRMVDASVSYGSSGGGVFDAEAGALIGIGEGSRAGEMAWPDRRARRPRVPVAGETLVIPARSILDFLAASGLGDLVAK